MIHLRQLVQDLIFPKVAGLNGDQMLELDAVMWSVSKQLAACLLPSSDVLTGRERDVIRELYTYRGDGNLKPYLSVEVVAGGMGVKPAQVERLRRHAHKKLRFALRILPRLPAGAFIPAVDEGEWFTDQC